MARQSGWRTYYDMTRRQRNSLERKARKGDKEALEKFTTYSKSIRETANRRLRELEKAGLDYGPAYNHFMHYLQTEYRSNRIPTARQVGNDISEIRWINDFAVKFLRSPNSTVVGMTKSNAFRVEKLQEYGVLPKVTKDSSGEDTEEASWRNIVDFLRFLGSEEISTAIDGYGESDRVVDMMWDYWNKYDEHDRGPALILMKAAMARYNAGIKTFDEAMREVGVKVEDYKRYR